MIVVGFYFLFRRDLKIWWYKGQYKHNFVRIFLIGENKRVIEYFSFIKANMTVEYKNEAYTVNPEEVYHVGDIPTLFYCRNNPCPLSFTEARNGRIYVNTENLKLIMDQKLLKDRLMTEQLLKIILVCIIVNILICVGIAFKVFDVVSLLKGAGK